VIGLILMFLLYNLLGFGYWGSSAPVYVVGSVFSYLMNKNYTFSYKKKDHMSMVRFAVVQVLSYILAYMIARPLTYFILKNLILTANLNVRIIEQLAILVGMGFFIIFGYTGQRFFVFRKMNVDQNV